MRDRRDWREKRDGRGFEVRNASCSELHPPNFKRLVAPVPSFTLHGPTTWQPIAAR